MKILSKQNPKFWTAKAYGVSLALLLSITAMVISFMPSESFAVKGTFRYTITVRGSWLPSLAQRTMLELQYESSYEIVEPQLAVANSRLLRVGSRDLQSASNELVVGCSYGNFSQTIFAANSSGPNLPYPEFSYAERAIDIDIKNLIVTMNATDGVMTIFLYFVINDVEVTVCSNQYGLQGITIANEGVYFPSILLTIKSGNPVKLEHDNRTLASNLTNVSSGYIDLSAENRSFTSPMDLYNPIVLGAKEAVPWILTSTTVVIAFAAVLMHPKRAHPRVSETS